MKTSLFKSLLVFAIVATSPPSFSSAEPNQALQLNAVQPSGIIGHTVRTWYVYASGVIDEGAANRLKEFLATKKISPGSFIFLDSPGGNLLEAIALGRVIRAAGLVTYVNAANGMTTYGMPNTKPAVCASACTLAFLGGRFRFIDDQSIFAVHRFYFPESSPNDADAAQIISSAVVQYIRDMGVDPKLFTFSTGAGRSQVVIPTRQQLIDLNVINNGEEKPVWSIEAVPQGLYLRGEHNTELGDQKLILLCAKGRRVTVVGFFPSRGRDKFLVEEQARSLVLDGQTVRIPLTRTLGPTLKNGIATVFLFLDASETQMVLRAHTIGLSMQVAYEAPMFDGIADFSFNEGGEKLKGLLASCR